MLKARKRLFMGFLFTSLHNGREACTDRCVKFIRPG